MSFIVNALKTFVLSFEAPPAPTPKPEATQPTAAPRVENMPHSRRDVFVRGRPPRLPAYRMRTGCPGGRVVGKVLGDAAEAIIKGLKKADPPLPKQAISAAEEAARRNCFACTPDELAKKIKAQSLIDACPSCSEAEKWIIASDPDAYAFQQLSLAEQLEQVKERAKNKERFSIHSVEQREVDVELQKLEELRKKIADKYLVRVDVDIAALPDSFGRPRPDNPSLSSKLYQAEAATTVLRKFYNIFEKDLSFGGRVKKWLEVEQKENNDRLRAEIKRLSGVDFDIPSWLNDHPEVRKRFFVDDDQGSYRVPYQYQYTPMESIYRVEVDRVILSQYRDYYAALAREQGLPARILPEPDFSQVEVTPSMQIHYDRKGEISLSLKSDALPEEAAPPITRNASLLKAMDARKKSAPSPAELEAFEAEIEREFGISIDLGGEISQDPQLFKRLARETAEEELEKWRVDLDEKHLLVLENSVLKEENPKLVKAGEATHPQTHLPKKTGGVMVNWSGYIENLRVRARWLLLEHHLGRYGFHLRQIDRLRDGFKHVSGTVNPYQDAVLKMEYGGTSAASSWPSVPAKEGGRKAGAEAVPTSAPDYLAKLDQAYQAQLNGRPQARHEKQLLRLVVSRWMARSYRTADGPSPQLQGVFADALLWEISRHPQLRLNPLLDKKALEAQIKKITAHPDLKAWADICFYEQAIFEGSPAPDGSLIKYENRDQHIKKLQELSQQLRLDDETRLRLLGTLRARIEAEQAYPAASGKSAKELKKLKNQYVEDSVLKQRPFDKIFARTARSGKLEIQAEDLLAIKVRPMPPDWEKWTKVQDAIEAPVPASLEVDNPQLASFVGQGPIPWTVLIPGGSANPMQDSAVYYSEREFKRFVGQLPDSSGVKLHVDSSGVQVQQLAAKLKARPTPILTLVTHGVPGPTPFDSAAFATRNPRIEVFRGLSAQVEAKLLDQPVSVPEFKQDAAQCFCATKKAATQMATAEGKTAMIPNSAIVNQVRLYQRGSGSKPLVGFVTGSCDGVELAAEMIESAGLKFTLGFSGKVNARWTTKLLIDFTQRIEQGKPIKTALIEAQKALLEEAAKERENRVQYQKLAWEVVENTYLFVRKDSSDTASLE